MCKIMSNKQPASSWHLGNQFSLMYAEMWMKPLLWVHSAASERLLNVCDDLTSMGCKWSKQKGLNVRVREHTAKKDFHDIYTCNRVWKMSRAAARQSPVPLVCFTLSSWKKSVGSAEFSSFSLTGSHSQFKSLLPGPKRKGPFCHTAEIWACLVQNFQHFSADLHAAQHICALTMGRSIFQSFVAQPIWSD